MTCLTVETIHPSWRSQVSYERLLRISSKLLTSPLKNASHAEGGKSDKRTESENRAKSITINNLIDYLGFEHKNVMFHRVFRVAGVEGAVVVVVARCCCLVWRGERPFGLAMVSGCVPLVAMAVVPTGGAIK